MRNELDFVITKQMERTAAALRRNRMLVDCVDSADEVVPLLRSLIGENDTIASGRSATLEECGVPDFFAAERPGYIDRHAGKTPEERKSISQNVAVADWFLASANAITENGEIYQVDGHSSRIGPMVFGPKHVILVAGYNKIVPDLDAAKLRVERIAAPANARRQGSETPCAVTGVCQHCSSPGRICANTLILSHQRIENRIRVILVKEILGY